MNKTFKIKTNYITQFNNVTHAKFNKTQYDQVAKVDLLKINVSADMLKVWKDAIDVETELNNEAQASEITKQMIAKDRERDEILTYIFGIIRISRYAPNNASRNAAEKLYAKLKKYFGIQSEVYESESMHILGMKKDVDKFPGEIAVLNLNEAITKLINLNTEYEQLASSRRDDSLLLKLPSTKEARQTTDNAFDAVCQCIQASYLISHVEADRRMISDLVDAMNKISSDFRDTHAQSQAQKAAAKKKKEGDDKNPSDPKKPGDDGKKPDDSKKPDDGKKPEDPKKPGGDTPKPGREEDPGEDQV